MDLLGVRILQALAYSRMSQRQAAMEIGISPQALNKWIKSGNAKKEYLIRFAEITRVNVEWLLTGNGKMSYSTQPYDINEIVPDNNHGVMESFWFDDDQKPKEKQAKDHSQLDVRLDDLPMFSFKNNHNSKDVILLPDLNEKSLKDAGIWTKLRNMFAHESPFVDIPYFREAALSAGNGHFVNNDEATHTLTFQKEWLGKMGLHPSSLVVVPCKGDSMEPRLCDGDVVLINTDKSTFKQIEDGRVYAINYGGEARIKRLIKRFDGSLIIRSDNQSQEYTDEVVTQDMSDQLHIIGKAVWVGGTL